MIGQLDIQHGWRSERDPRYSKLYCIYTQIIYVASDRLKHLYNYTLEATRLGYFTANNQVIDITKDRQIYLLFLDGVIFEEFDRYNQLIDRYE